jgi:hypothetical protein
MSFTIHLQPGSFRSNFITPAVIGSLPKGLSHTEKAGIAANSWTPSPAAQRLAEQPEVGNAHCVAPPLQGAVQAGVPHGRCACSVACC